MILRNLCILFCAILVASCGTREVSDVDFSDVQAGKKAIVKSDNVPLLAGMIFGEMPVVSVIGIDNKEVDVGRFSLDSQIAIDVGPHEIEFSCSDRSSKDKGYKRESIYVVLKPFHEYIVDCDEEYSVRLRENKID